MLGARVARGGGFFSEKCEADTRFAAVTLGVGDTKSE